MSTPQPSTPDPRERLTNAAVYVILFVLGLLQGVIGSFQYSQDPAPFIAILLAVIIFATCVFGGWGMRSTTGGVVPALGWFIASFALSAGSSQGSVIIAATSPGMWYLYGGALAAALGAGISFIRQFLDQAARLQRPGPRI
jgi:hypothetical protein